MIFSHHVCRFLELLPPSATATLEWCRRARRRCGRSRPRRRRSTTVGRGGTGKGALPHPFGRGNNPAEAAPIPIGRGHGCGGSDGDGVGGDWTRPRPLFRPRSRMLECTTAELFQRQLATLQGCGRDEIEGACNGEGRIQGGIAAARASASDPSRRTCRALASSPLAAATGARAKGRGKKKPSPAKNKSGKVGNPAAQ